MRLGASQWLDERAPEETEKKVARDWGGISGKCLTLEENRGKSFEARWQSAVSNAAVSQTE